MKWVKMIILCFLIAICTNTTTFASEIAENEYLTQINQIIEKYGLLEGNENIDSSWIKKGLIYGEFIDFDNNGQDEMLLIYKYEVEEAVYETRASVYAFKNGKLAEVFNEGIYSEAFRTDASFKVEIKNDISNKYLIVSAGGSETKEKLIVFTMNNGEAQTHIYYGEADVDFFWETFDVKYVYCTIDGQQVTPQEYERKRGYLKENSITVHLLISDYVTENDMHRYCSYNSVLQFIEEAKSKTPVSVTLDGDKLVFDQPPVIVNGRTLVPIRAVVEAMDGTVEWNGDTRTVKLTLGDNTILLTIDSATAYFNNTPYTLDVPPQIINGRTLLPIRFVAEKFNFNVDWNNDTRTVVITKSNAVQTVPVNSVYPNVSDIMSEQLKEEFRMFIKSELSACDISQEGYDILTGYDCEQPQNIRLLMWYQMSEFTSSYLKSLEKFNMFDDGNTVRDEYSLSMKTRAEYLDMIIHEYYNIPGEIPEFEKQADFGAGSIYYEDGYYYTVPSYVGFGDFKVFIQDIYDMGNNRYYFLYRIASDTLWSGWTTSYLYPSTYCAIMERKTLHNQPFEGLEFWSVRKTSLSPLIPNEQLGAPNRNYKKYEGVWHKIDPDGLNPGVTNEILSIDENRITIPQYNDDGTVGTWTGDINNNQLLLTQYGWFEDPNHPMYVTLTFYEDFIFEEYSECAVEWYDEIFYVRK